MLGIAAAAIAEGAGRAARPRSVAAESDKGRLMSVYDTARDKLRAHDRDEPNGHGIGPFGHGVSDDSEGELVAIYSPAGGAMDGQIAYARPRDFIDLEDHR